MKRSGLIPIILVLIVFMLAARPLPVPAHSSADTCPEIVQTALSMTDQLCNGTGRNQVCYGHVHIDAESQPGIDGFNFDQGGDQVRIADLQSLRLSVMDETSGYWGIALMRLQASLAENNITLLLFGDVAVENASTQVPLLNITTQAAANVNVRQQPALNAAVVGKLPPGQLAQATGRLADGSWIRVLLPDFGVSGWVFAELLAVEGDVDTLAVVEPAAQYYGPMQAFYLESGIRDAACPEAPNSGLLIQTPDGVAEVTFLINEVNVQLGSTVYFQARPEEGLAVRVVEGKAQVEVDGQVQTAVAGTEVTVPLDASGKPAGPPTEPKGYDMAMVGSLPVSLLERTVTVHPPLTEAEIEDLAVESGASETLSFGEAVEAVEADEAGDDGETPAQDGEPANPDVPAGIIDNPGLDGTIPPGLGGDAPPGQVKEPPGQTKDKE
jgi:hypothetical protein